MAKSSLTVGILLFADYETLDIMGPVELLGVPPSKSFFELLFITHDGLQVRSAQGVVMIPNHSFEDCPLLDVLLVPGGRGTRRLVDDADFLSWLRQQYSGREQPLKFLLSVCTGSALLAKAGLLDGKKATSNNMAFEWAKSQSAKTHWVKHARWVEDGNVLTSSGVSAGMDLTLYFIAKVIDDKTAQEVARYAEYDGQWTDSTADKWSEPGS